LVSSRIGHTASRAGATFILIDDVAMSGGHLRACAAMLRKHGRPCGLAICAGRTVYEQLDNPFEVPAEAFEDFIPS
jgi:pyrimidine operon attenuation protein/uracil phosphoribosyltransferase